MGALVVLVPVFVCLSVLSQVGADTPANCTYEDVKGTWVFQIGQEGYTNTLNCTSFNNPQVDYKVELLFPDLAIDQFGNKGFWTLIYNQGFELVIGGRKYFAFSKYKQSGSTVVSMCDQILPGWSHDVLGHNWACFLGAKNERQKVKVHTDLPRLTGYKYQSDIELIKTINQGQNSWKAVQYPQFENMDFEDMIRMAGGRKSRIHNKPSPAPITQEQHQQLKSLPAEFDWRNVDGSNFVSPIRNQASCGSCYAFSSLAMNEARVRILTNNTRQPVFSTQDIVECSEYSQGCEGGFPYLIGGKYAEDFGLVEESCNPYKGRDDACSTVPNCPREYSTRYEYVGGFYGACNEALMRINLVKYGPMAVAFEVYNDFMHYKSGVYHHTGAVNKFNPFEITNHAVLLVGYGTDTSDMNNPKDYWIVKNGWGTGWGEDDYFRILRGVDECSIESIAVQSFPVM
uniref:Dipeptidyl peptidase 1 n=1 Tax=Sinonovacula constricta TaxID=98310 RepID=A0A023PJH7_SINCO|nr:cathepsin C [Sinonovacula constricta]